MISATIAISIDTILPAFDELAGDLDIGDGSESLAITVFLIGMGLGMPIWGPLSDRYGRKPILWISLAIFVLGAIVAATASSFGVFLVGRIIWGAAAAGPRTVGLAIVRDSYEGDEMARIMSLTSAVFLTVPILAPGVGEVILTFASWRATNLVGAVLGIAVAGWLFRMNETLHSDHVRPLELAPLLDATRTVLRTPTTVWFTIAATFAYGAFFPWLGSSVQIFDGIYDRGNLFALLFGANAIAMAVAILLSERSVRRFSTSPVVLVLSTTIPVAALAWVMLALAADGVPDFWVWFAATTVLTSLNAALSPLLQTQAMQPMGAIAGLASSMTGAFIFVVSAVLGSIIDRFIDDTVTPFGVGFVVYGTLGLLAVLAARQARASSASKTAQVKPPRNR